MDEDMDPFLVAATSSLGAYSFPVYEPPEWNQHKELITELYKKMELKDVMKHMQDEHGFRASENQYKKQISKWGLNTKHVKAREYKAMIRVRTRREQKEGKQTEFILHGQKVSDQNIARFEDRMIKSEKMSKDETFSDVSTPDSLIARTPTPPEVGTSTMLQVPSRPAPFERSPSIGIEGRKFFAGEQSAFEGLESEQMKEVMSQISFAEAVPSELNTSEIENAIRQFSRPPENTGDQDELNNMISQSQVLCDDFCNQCEAFGFRPGAWGCLLHRCLSRIFNRFRTGKINTMKAEVLCRGIIHNLLSAQQPPLASLLRVAADIIWFSVQVGKITEAARFAVVAQFPHNLLDPRQCESLYRPLLAQTALTLALVEHYKEAILTLKSVLGPDFDDLREVWELFIVQDLNASTLSLERAVTELTTGRVRAFHDGGGWLFFDGDAEAELEPPEVWYRDEHGNLRREEIIVRGIAVRTMVEVEYQRRKVNVATRPSA